MNRAVEIAKTVATIIIAIAAVAMMVFTIISSTTLNQSERSLFGKHMFIVMSDSMSATDFSAGDLVVSSECNPSELVAGDIISFSSRNSSNFGEVLTHKIRERATDESGNPGFVTYGTTTGTNDEKVVTYSQVIGKYSFSVPKVGYFLDFLKSVPGYLLCIFLPFALLIALQAANVYQAFKEYRNAELVNMHEERRSLAREREEAQAMRRELEAMRAQFGDGVPPIQYQDRQGQAFGQQVQSFGQQGQAFGQQGQAQAMPWEAQAQTDRYYGQQGQTPAYGQQYQHVRHSRVPEGQQAQPQYGQPRQQDRYDYAPQAQQWAADYAQAPQQQWAQPQYEQPQQVQYAQPTHYAQQGQRLQPSQQPQQVRRSSRQQLDEPDDSVARVRQPSASHARQSNASRGRTR